VAGCSTLELAEPFTCLDARRERHAVEAAITALQLDWLRQKGARVESGGNFFLEGLPPVGRGSLIGFGVVIKGDCRIGRNVTIYPNCFIENSRIGDGCTLLPGSIVRDSILEKHVQLGPYCHVRNGSLVRRGAKMGNFVEMKKSVLGPGSKAMHLSYLGDATIGGKVNIGAGTITCNYDGKKKNPTTIGDRVFIGSGTELVAPVTVNSDSYVGAGSTITEDVPRHALAVARQRQKNIPGWVLRKKKK
jgi:bifunctional UDP-N-acetylglucosamine pyrophosphorylase/glucosamine-1-phosphate N-acetyltransferase